jgi:NADH dehydrogenase FAD-containing subunit
MVLHCGNLASVTRRTIMSSTGTNLVQTIETDIKAWLAGAAKEAETIGLGAWNILKSIFLLFTSKQLQIAMDILTKLDVDTLAGKSLEEIEADMLNTAEGEELAALEAVGSAGLQAFIALFKAQQTI